MEWGEEEERRSLEPTRRQVSMKEGGCGRRRGRRNFYSAYLCDVHMYFGMEGG